MPPIAIVEYTRGDFTISTDRARLDLGVIHGFLSESYWAKGVSIDIVQRSIEHTLCCGVYYLKQQVGFARLITDYTTFAYLADVFIVEAYWGQGLSKWLMESILKHPDVQGFFFQAEDGIRDDLVTGVQTCALPI